MKEKILYLLSALLSKLYRWFGNRNYDFENIQVIKLDEIGDMVTSLHVFYHLHQTYPKAQIHVQCKPFNQIFFKHLPYITASEHAFASPDLIIDLRGNFNSLWYAIRSGAKYRLDRGTIRLKNKLGGAQLNELITNFQIIEPLLKRHTPRLHNGIRCSEEEHSKVIDFLRSNEISKFVVLHIGARDAARRWPVERYMEVMSHLNERGFHCILAGGASDKELNDKAIRQNPRMNINGSEKFNLLEFSCLCEKARLFIGNESGPLHIAAANQIPIIALFGPGVRDVFYPLGSHVIIHHYFKARGHKNQKEENSTILEITTEEVIESVNTLLNEG